MNYDEENWRLITEFLKSVAYKDVHVLNRAQLIDDAFNIARIGKLRYSVALELIEFLKQEVDYIPWYSTFQSLSYLKRILANTDSYESFKVFHGGNP